MPRFASLSSDKVFMREGPTYRHPILWVYHRRGLPVEIVAQYDVWRKVRDADGTTGWVHASMIAERRTVVVTAARPAPVRRSDDPHAPILALASKALLRSLKPARRTPARSKPREPKAGSKKRTSGECGLAKYSGDELLHRQVIAASSEASFGDIAAGGVELSGDPSAAVADDALGTAQWLHGRSTTGDRAASPLGQVSWAVFEWARNPYVLLITIYLFSPYFARVVVGDGVKGQALWGAIAAVGGLIVAALAPFLGAIADAGGRRKPWIAIYTVIMAIAMLTMWFAKPFATGWMLVAIGASVAVANVSFEFSAVFHNSLLPTIAQPKRVAACRDWVSRSAMRPASSSFFSC